MLHGRAKLLNSFAISFGKVAVIAEVNIVPCTDEVV